MNRFRSIFSFSATVLILLGFTVSVFAQTPVWSQFPNSPGGTGRHDDIYFTDATNGWATQNNNIYRTTNGGVTWTTNLTLAGTHFRSIAFTTPKIGFAGNLGKDSYDPNTSNTNVLYRSYDGGVTWSNVPGLAEAGMRGFCSIFVLDSQHIYGGGRVRGPAFVAKSSDGGTNWTTVNLTAAGVMNGIMDIYFHDQTNGWVVGMDTHSYSSPPYYGRIAKTTDGGNTWTTVLTTTIANCYFWKISWPSRNVGYVALQQNGSYNKVVYYKTTDGGNNWVSNGIPLSAIGNPASFYLQGMSYVSTNEGWMGGATGIPALNSFIHTTDGGATWSPAGYTNTYSINRIRFLSPTLGYASGAMLHIFTVPVAITAQPQSKTVVGPTNVNLTVAAVGTPPLKYQWKKNGTNASGQTNATLSLEHVLRSDAGTYSVFITNGFYGVQSSNVTLRVLVPERLSQPIRLPGDNIQLQFEDADGGPFLTTVDLASFHVYASTNLIDWQPITNSLTLTNGSMIFRDTITNSSQRYYKVLEQ